MRFEVYRDRRGKWRWRLLAANRKTIADSGQGYSRQRDCLRMVLEIQAKAPDAEIEEV